MQSTTLTDGEIAVVLQALVHSLQDIQQEINEADLSDEDADSMHAIADTILDAFTKLGGKLVETETSIRPVLSLVH